MKHFDATLAVAVALATAALPACERSPRDLTSEELATIKAEIKAELKTELETELRGTPRTGAAPPVQLSAAERAAIAEARAGSVAPAAPAAPPVVSPRLAPSEPAEPPPGEPTPPGDDEGDDPELPPPPTPSEPVQPADAAEQEAGPAREVRPGMLVYPAAGDLQLVDLAIATAVTNREPQDVRVVYEHMPELFFCYTVFANPNSQQMVTHVWRHGGRMVSKVELEVGKSPKWRTWSRQRTRKDWAGPWSCEVLGPDGRRIGIASFDVGG